MSRIVEIDGTSQDVLYVFDFKTFKRTAFIDFKNKLIHADLSGKDFEPLLCFPFLEKAIDPDRRVECLILDCKWIGPEKITMEILPGLIKAMPHVDPETIQFYVKGKKKKQGETIYWPDIGFIMVYAEIQEKFKTRIINDVFNLKPVEGTNKEDTQEQEGEPGSTSIDKEYETMQRLHEAYIPPYQKSPTKKQDKPYEIPKTQEAPKKKTKAKVLHFPKYPTTPKDWMKYAEKVVGGSNLKPIARQLYRRSKRMYLKNVPHYPKETTRRGCYYFCGVEYLARVAGRAEKTVRMVLKALAEAKLIYIRYHGYKGRGCSIIEVPPNIKLVMRWRREHKG